MSRAHFCVYPTFFPSASGGWFAFSAAADLCRRLRETVRSRQCGAALRSERARQYVRTVSAKHEGTSAKEYHTSNRASEGHCFNRYFGEA